MAVQVASIRSGLRDSQYGVLLRVPADRLPNLGGTNSWGGTNSFQDLFVQNLYVQQTLEIYDANVDVSAGASAQLGTADPWDFWLKSNGIARFGVTSAGAYLFTSSQPSSIFSTVLFTDAFTRADEYPLGGWTTQAGASALRLSANAVHASAGGALAIGAAYPTSDTWDLSAADAQALISGDGAVSDRTGVSVFMASGGASGYDVVFQQNVDQIQIRKRTSPTADSSLGSFASQGHFGTLRALASAGTTTTWISAFKNGAYVGVGTDSSSPYRVGFAGLRMGSDNPPTGRTFADDFVHNSTTAPPFGTGDIVWQTSASLWDMLGATGATKHAQVFSDSLQLGFSKPVVFTGLTSAFMSAGTSAYFNTATYGVVRLASAVGTPGLSGVVGFSATGAAQFSAISNDLVLLKTDVYGLSAVGTSVSGASGVVALSGVGLTVSAVGAATIMLSAGAGGSTAAGLYALQNFYAARIAGVSASAIMYATADHFQVVSAGNAVFVGTGLAVSADVTISGAGGRDVSAFFAAPSWLYCYVISGLSGVNVVLSSAVPSAGPVLPGGYTAQGFLAAIRYDAASSISAFNQVGAWYQWFAQQNVLTGGTATSPTAISLASYVPPIAQEVQYNGNLQISAGGATGAASLITRFNLSAQNLAAGALRIGLDGLAVGSEPIFGDVVLSSPNVGQTLYYAHTVTTGSNPRVSVNVVGFRVPNGAG